MRLQEFVQNLQRILTDNPEYSELEVVTAIDEEGNGFNAVGFTPTLGIWEDDSFRELNDANAPKATTICVN